MQLSVKWLSEIIDVPQDVEVLADDLTNCGLKVDEICRFPLDKENLVVAEVTECEKHPDADKLHVCKVNSGTETHTIVCGAENVRSNMKVVLAKPGFVMPAGFTVENRKLKGIVSEGVLVSERELGISDDHAGIIEMDPSIETGTYYADYYNRERLNLDMDITANRGDALSILGTARDCVALYHKEIKDVFRVPEEKGGEIDFSINIECPELCTRYVSRIVKDVKIETSPMWLQEKIRSMGGRPINNVVDITNYILFLTGHPMHAFDLAELKGNKIIVRKPHDGEKITTLDEVERDLLPETCLICDGERAVAIGGVMGGLDSEVKETTKDLLLEVAVFNPQSIRKTSKHLGLKTDSSHRFERGVDFSDCIDVVNLAASMLEEIAGGTTEKGIIDIYPEELKQNIIEFSPERARRFIGDNISNEKMVEILKSLRFELEEKGDNFLVTVPPFRYDIEMEVELIEEVLRIYGYNSVPSTLPSSLRGATIKSEYFCVQKIRDYLASIGFYEICQYGFISREEVDKYNIDGNIPLTILNPLGQEFSTIRTSLIPSMFKTVKSNIAKGNKEYSLFEIGKIARLEKFSGEIKNTDVVIKHENVDHEVIEEYRLAVSMNKTSSFNGWNKDSRIADFYDFKFYLEKLFSHMGKNLEMKPLEKAPFFLHPGISAEIFVDGESCGIAGQLHPEFSRTEKLPDTSFMAEIKIDRLFEAAKHERISEVSKYPAALFDLAIVVKEEIAYSEIRKIIDANGGEFLQEVNLFDMYAGERLEQGMKSLAFSLKFQSVERTLKDEEVKSSVNKIFGELEKNLGAKLREL